jgi:hypothetical protein
MPEIPQDIRDSIKATMETAVDFVIDIFSTSPFSNADIFESVCMDTRTWAELNYGVNSSEEEKEAGDWVATLYNDESHSFPDVVTQLRLLDSSIYPGETGMSIAEVVDQVGRAPILESPNLSKVVKGATGFGRIGLFCSVRTKRDYLRECLGAYILEWLNDCISIGVSVGGNEMILREILCEVLASPWSMGISKCDERIELDPSPPEQEKRFSSNWAVSSPDSDRIEEQWKERLYIRLDWILFLDCRLWKAPRKCVRSMILGCLLGGKAAVAGSTVDQWSPKNWKRITGMLSHMNEI